MMGCDNEWREVDRDLSETVVSDCALFMVAICVICLVLRFLFRTLVGVLSSVVLRVTT